MTIKNGIVAYTNKNYMVVTLDEPLLEEGFESTPQPYAMVNKDTRALEGYSSYLPGAIQIVNGLSEKLEELLPDKADNVVMLEVPE